MAYSFKKALETIVQPMIAKGRIKPFVKDPESQEMKDFFNSENLEKLAAKLPKDTAEYYVADLILLEVVNSPAKGKTTVPKKARVFVSDEQKAHFNLYHKVTELTEAFWKECEEYKQLVALERTITRERKGEKETVKLAITPTVYQRDSKAIINSYEVA